MTDAEIRALLVVRHGELSSGRRLWLVGRSAVFWLWQIATTFTMGLPVLLGSLVGFNIGWRAASFWLRLNVYGLKWICGVHWRVEGREHIPDRPCVVLAKHQSTWETYFLPLVFDPAIYVAKRSLIWVPIFGWSLYALRFILIDRKSGRNAVRQMVEQARDRLAKGRWLLIFPEGTRRPVGAPPAYRAGGAVVATELGVPVLPVALDAGVYWPRHGFIKYPGTITVSIGPPIESAGRNASAVIDETERWIEGRLEEIYRAT